MSIIILDAKNHSKSVEIFILIFTKYSDNFQILLHKLYSKVEFHKKVRENDFSV